MHGPSPTAFAVDPARSMTTSLTLDVGELPLTKIAVELPAMPFTVSAAPAAAGVGIITGDVSVPPALMVPPPCSVPVIVMPLPAVAFR